MKPRKIVYVSGAISAPSGVQRGRNIRRLQRCGIELARAGYAPIVPGADLLVKNGHKSVPRLRWLDVDLSLILRCDAVFRLLPDPAGLVSKGAEREVAFARKHGIPVVSDIYDLEGVL